MWPRLLALRQRIELTRLLSQVFLITHGQMIEVAGEAFLALLLRWWRKWLLFRKEIEFDRAMYHAILITLMMILFYFATLEGIVIMMFLGGVFFAGDWAKSRYPWLAERVKNMFGTMIRPEEWTRLSGTAHFVLAGELILFAHLFLGLPKDIIVCAVMFLAVGDPMARIVGRTIGGLKVIGTKKTVAGAIGFSTFGLAAAVILCEALGLSYSWTALIAGCAAATVAELYTKEWDNFSIPIWATLAIWTVRTAF